MAMNERSLSRAPDAAADAALDGRIAESLVIRGDVSGLSPKDRALFYVKLCGQLGLNPMTQPLQLLKLNGREILYPTRGATDQLASNHRINREIIEGPLVRDFAGTKLGYCVCRATHPNGRVETAVASLPVSGDIAMLPMKLETKAKRRATLSILGLGMLDEVEVESIPAREKSAAEPIDLALAGTATPIDYLRDDLASVSTPEGIREAYRTHASAIAEMDEDGAAIRAARNACHEAVTSHGFGSTRADTDRILGKGEVPAASKPFEPPALVAMLRDVDKIELPGEAVLVWMKHRAEIASLTPAEREAAWQALCKQTEDVGKMKNAKVWLKRAIADEDARRQGASMDSDPSLDPPAEREVEVLVAAEHPAVTALREALDVAKSVDGVVAVWRQAGGEVKTLDEGQQFNAWTLAVEAGARISGTTRADAEVALRAMLAGPKGDGPKGTRKATAKPANDAQGSSAEGSASAVPQARAPLAESAPYVAADGAEAWAARVARYTNTIELRRSWERHVPSFRAAGVLEARRAVSVARLQALASVADEAVAQRVLDDAERAADAAARRPHVPSAGEMRRRQREAQERAGQREVAQAYAKAS